MERNYIFAERARVLHSATVANGFIYVLGGANPIGTPLTTMYYAKIKSDGTLGTWNTTTDYPDDILEAPMVFLNGYIYVLGGFYNNGLTDDVRYAKVNTDGSLGSWTLVTNGTNGLPAGRTAGAAIAVNGFIYFTGGNDNSVRQDETYYVRPNPSTGDISGAFSTATNLPVTIDQHNMISSNGYLYAIGGRGPTATDTSQTAIYRATINSSGVPSSWTTSGTGMPALTTGRAGAGAVLVNGHIYVVGGHAGSSGSYTLNNSLERISTSRVSVGASLDLVGLQNDGNLSEEGSSGTTSSGGALTAGSGMFIGGLSVQGETNLLGTLSVGGNANFTGGLSLGSIDTTGALLVLDTKSSSGDPTGILGAMYYNGSRGKMRCFELDTGSTGYWLDCVETRRTNLNIGHEMFNNSSGEFLFFSAGGVGTFTEVAGVVGHPGIQAFGTGTSATERTAIAVDSDGDVGFLLGGGDVHRFETVLRVPTLSVLATQAFVVRAGYNDAAGDPTDGCIFKYSDNVNSGEWQGYCADAGSSTCDTNIAVVANTWYRLTIVPNSAGTSVDFQVNGVSACQVTSQIPDTAGNETGGAVSITKTVGTTARTIQVDYVEFKAQLTPR